MENIVMSLCDRSGNILKPWAEEGYRCIAIDIEHSGINKIEGIEYTQADVFNYEPPPGNYIFSCAFPPCTHLAVSGRKHFKTKSPELIDNSIKLFLKCIDTLEKINAPYFVENPVSIISTRYRKPDYSFHPYEFARYLTEWTEIYNECYTKKTCLWTNDKFVFPEKKGTFPWQRSKLNRLPPSENRAYIRSITPMGFSQAVFIANHTKGV